MVLLKAVPTVPEKVEAVTTGGEGKTMLKDIVLEPLPAPLVAVTVTEAVLTADGVPEITPVVAFIDNPAGKVPAVTA